MTQGYYLYSFRPTLTRNVYQHEITLKTIFTGSLLLHKLQTPVSHYNYLHVE